MTAAETVDKAGWGLFLFSLIVVLPLTVWWGYAGKISYPTTWGGVFLEVVGMFGGLALMRHSDRMKRRPTT